MSKKGDNWRKNNLSFLRGLLRGGRSVKELRTPRNPFLLGYADNPGVYKELPSGKLWTEMEIQQYERQYPGDKVFRLFATGTDGDEFERSLTEFIKKCQI